MNGETHPVLPAETVAAAVDSLLLPLLLQGSALSSIFSWLEIKIRGIKNVFRKPSERLVTVSFVTSLLPSAR